MYAKNGMDLDYSCNFPAKELPCEEGWLDVFQKDEYFDYALGFTGEVLSIGTGAFE